MSRTRKFIAIEQTRGRKQLVFRVTLPELKWLRAIRRHVVDYALSLGLLVAGVTGITYAIVPSFFPPTTTSTANIVVDAPPEPTSLLRSIPTRLEVPDIGLTTDLIQLGQNPDGSLETPSDYEHAGWYKYSPTPGEIGPAIITGHVDSYQGPAVFFYLKDLQPKQLIYVHREDGSVVRFQVDSVALFEQAAFPTKEVYGDIEYAGLRLITCGGVFNVLTGQYSHNTVVYASYVSG
jgi:sortase (surface protein transpeptidase)